MRAMQRATASGDDPYRMHPLTLRFSQPVEDRFGAEYIGRSIGQARASIVIGAASLLVAAVFASVFLAQREIVWASMVAMALLSVVTFVATFSPALRPRLPLVTAVTAIAYTTVVDIATFAATPGAYRAFAFLVAASQVVYLFFVVRLGFVTSFVTCTMVVAVFLGLAVYLGEYGPVEMTVGTSLLVLITMASAVGGYFLERFARHDFVSRCLLEVERQRAESERQRADDLLLNILPEEIADRLKAQKRTIADNFEEVTVLFADVVNFTGLSARMTPEALVNTLDTVFTCFDRLTERHGLEKIKTIGDAYMVVAGVPTPQPDHLDRMARMALGMQEALRDWESAHGLPIQVRIGIHTGPAVAGVIGTKKFAYDLWGDTVNTASRMESHGVPACIQVTDAVYQRLRDAYVFEPRGEIEVKGKGPVRAYLLRGQRETDQPTSDAGAAAASARVPVVG
jgi:class 3 adenylate cyclase